MRCCFRSLEVIPIRLVAPLGFLHLMETCVPAYAILKDNLSQTIFFNSLDLRSVPTHAWGAEMYGKSGSQIKEIRILEKNQKINQRLPHSMGNVFLYSCLSSLTLTNISQKPRNNANHRLEKQNPTCPQGVFSSETLSFSLFDVIVKMP